MRTFFGTNANKFAVSLFAWIVALLAMQFAFGALTITDPGVDEEMKVKTMYTYQGSGGVDNHPNPDTPVIVRLYQDDPPTQEWGSAFDETIGTNGDWIISAQYTGPASDDGVVVVSQQGNVPSASVTVDWN